MIASPNPTFCSSSTALAVGAKPTADVKGQYNAVAHFHSVNACTDLDDLTQVLMTENPSFFHIGTTFIHMQVRTTDIGGGDADENVRWFFDACIGNILDTDFFWSLCC